MRWCDRMKTTITKQLNCYTSPLPLVGFYASASAIDVARGIGFSSCPSILCPISIALREFGKNIHSDSKGKGYEFGHLVFFVLI